MTDICEILDMLDEDQFQMIEQWAEPTTPPPIPQKSPLRDSHHFNPDLLLPPKPNIYTQQPPQIWVPDRKSSTCSRRTSIRNSSSRASSLVRDSIPRTASEYSLGSLYQRFVDPEATIIDNHAQNGSDAELEYLYSSFDFYQQSSSLNTSNYVSCRSSITTTPTTTPPSADDDLPELDYSITSTDSSSSSSSPDSPRYSYTNFSSRHSDASSVYSQETISEPCTPTIVTIEPTTSHISIEATSFEEVGVAKVVKIRRRISVKAVVNHVKIDRDSLLTQKARRFAFLMSQVRLY